MYLKYICLPFYLRTEPAPGYGLRTGIEKQILECPLFFALYYLKPLSKCGMINNNILILEG